MRDAVVCLPLRTPVGRYGGALKEIAPQQLAAVVIRELVERSGISPELVDDVVLGNAYPSGEFPAIGRVAALDAGLPVRVPGVQVDRRCGSGLYAVAVAAMQVQSGASDLVVAGGAESMSGVEYYATGLRFGHPAAAVQLHDRLARGRVTAGGADHLIAGGMLETAENLRREFGIGRTEQDELALASHERAVAAQRSGSFDDELVPVTVPGRKGDTVVTEDEHPRADSSLEALSRLRPVLADSDPDATVTAGNASGQNDGAAACLVTTSEVASRLGLVPLARLVSWSVAGVEPERMGIGPVEASARALHGAGRKLADMDLIELNEAFAAQVLAVTRAWELTPADFARLNVNGSGISLGHPVGATGARILATLLNEMHRRNATYALETMCIGGGQGIAAVFEAVR